jgi:bifunctional DNA-binding transcriptional regulator/antitoxin component of YhaV-PrlF toxin-antitoxin module
MNENVPFDKFRANGEFYMALLKVVATIEKDGKITLPGNIRRAVGLKQGQVVELKIVGTGVAKKILLASRKRARSI